jgi:hypothetical protein
MQMSYFLFIALGLYFIVTTFQRWRRDGVNPLKPTALFVIAVILGLVMSAVQYVTPYQYLHKYSMRTLRTQSENKYEYATSWSMNFEEVTADFIPEFCGDNVQNQRQSYWGPNVFKLNSEHFGIIPLFLAILAIGLWNRRGKWFFFWTAIIATTYALGAHTPLFRLYYLLPGVNSFRGPGMINFLVGFSVIILGAMGLESFLTIKKSDKTYKKTWHAYTYITIGYTVFAMLIIILQMNFFKLWFAIFDTPDAQKVQTLQASLDIITIGALISLVAVWGLFIMLKYVKENKLKPQFLIIVLGLFTFIYMWHFNSRYIIPIDPKPYYAKQPIVDYFQKKQADEDFRVLIMPRTIKDYYLAYYDIEELSLTILHGNHLASFEKLAGRRSQTSGLIFQPVQDLLNAKYFLSNQPLPPQYFDPQRFKQIDRIGNYLIYENLTALPRAFPVYRYRVMEDEDQMVMALSMNTFDYRTALLFDEEPVDAPPVYPDSIEFGVVPARVFNKQNDRFKVDVEMVDDGFLFLSENYYPAWKAYENGVLLPTLKTDVTFRAIPLKRGHHTIECRFENKTYNATFAISKITFIVMLLALIGLIIKDKLGRRKTGADA